jgi:hypothetical protein
MQFLIDSPTLVVIMTSARQHSLFSCPFPNMDKFESEEKQNWQTELEMAAHHWFYALNI